MRWCCAIDGLLTGTRREDGAIAIEAVLAFCLFIAFFLAVSTWYNMHEYRLALENEAASRAKQEALAVYWATHATESKYGNYYYGLAKGYMDHVQGLLEGGLSGSEAYAEIAGWLGRYADEALQPYLDKIPDVVRDALGNPSLEAILTSETVADLLLDGRGDELLLDEIDIYSWYCRPIRSEKNTNLQFNYAKLPVYGEHAPNQTGRNMPYFQLTRLTVEKTIFPAIFSLGPEQACSELPYVALEMEGVYYVTIPFLGTFEKKLSARAVEPIWSARGNSVELRR